LDLKKGGKNSQSQGYKTKELKHKNLRIKLFQDHKKKANKKKLKFIPSWE
jgi:hypothetical protein